MPDGSLFYGSDYRKPEGARVLFPEPKNEAWRKRFCMFVLKSKGEVSHRMQQEILGDNYQDIVNSYGSNATETEILTVCASVYKEWLDPLIAENTRAIDINTAFIRGGFIGHVEDALGHFDNFKMIRDVAAKYRDAKA